MPWRGLGIRGLGINACPLSQLGTSAMSVSSRISYFGCEHLGEQIRPQNDARVVRAPESFTEAAAQTCNVWRAFFPAEAEGAAAQGERKMKRPQGAVSHVTPSISGISLRGLKRVPRTSYKSGLSLHPGGLQ